MTNHVAADASLPGASSAVETAGTPGTSTLPARVRSLTGLRFPAALMVFLYHASLPIPALRFLHDDAAAYSFYGFASQAGGLGVTFFFVLSGFVLTWSARPGDTATAFWRRRLVKIYPNYVVAWVLATVLYAAAYTPVWRELVNLLMLQVWIPDFNTYFSVDPPGWSLGCEAIFYLAFPILFVRLRKIRPERLKFWIGGMIAAIVGSTVLAYLVLPSSPAIPGESTVSVVQYWFGYILPPVRTLDFALGILVARAVQTGRWRNIGMLWSGLLLVATYAVTGFFPYLYGQRVLCMIPIVLLIAAAATSDVRGGFSPFRNRVMVWLGEVSFAFYLLHFIVLATTRKLLGTTTFPVPVTVALLAGVLLAAIGCSWLLYAGFERPITRRFSTAKPRTTPAVATP